MGKSEIKSSTQISRKWIKIILPNRTSPFFFKSQILRGQISNCSHEWMCKQIFNEKSRWRELFDSPYFMLWSSQSHVINVHRSHSTCTTTISQLVRCSFGIKLHMKQKCFDPSCIPFCVHKQAADLSQYNFFSHRISKMFNQISDQIAFFWIRSL